MNKDKHISTALNYFIFPYLWLASTVCAEFISPNWDIRGDYQRFYSASTLRHSAPMLGWAVASAHCGVDARIREHYQSHYRGYTGDRVAVFCKLPGEGKYMIPAALLTASLQWVSEDEPFINSMAGWGQAVTRAYLIGAPPMLLMQRLSGGSRPDETGHAAQWRLGRDANGVSGHAFMGAVPFLSLAEMLRESPVAHGFCLAVSALPAWSRVHDDKHYVSQAILGWLMAHLSVRAVCGRETNGFIPSPMMNPGATGLSWTFIW